MASGMPSQSVGDFFQGFLGRRPVYSNGRKIGYWTNVTEACQGILYIEPGAAKTDPNTWYTKDDFWRDVKVTDYCLTKGERPKWVTDEYVKSQNLTPNPGGGFTANTGALDPKLLIIGGAVLVAALLIGRR